MLSLAYYQAVILTTQLQPQLLYKHTSSYYILLGCKNQLQFRESHPTWAMIELEQTFEGGFDIYISSLVHLRHLTAHPNAKRRKVLLKWIVVYSTDKSQCIEVEGFLPPPVLSGVPKCACFLVFIIDGRMSL